MKLHRPAWTLTCVLLCLGAASAASPDTFGERVAQLATESPPTHCRFGKNDRAWLVRPGIPADFRTDSDRNFEVVTDFKPSPGDIRIETGDRFKIAEYPGRRLFLTHSRQRSGTGPYETVATGRLLLEFHGVWARGTAELPSGKPVGEYVLFRRPDSGTTYSPKECRHSENQGGRCRSLLIEYFDFDDRDNRRYLPAFDSENVEDLQRCRAREAANPGSKKIIVETSEGDGDEGPD